MAGFPVSQINGRPGFKTCGLSNGRHYFSSDEGDELFSLPAADVTCYAYSMVNRQDIPYSLGSPEIGRHRLAI